MKGWYPQQPAQEGQMSNREAQAQSVSPSMQMTELLWPGAMAVQAIHVAAKFAKRCLQFPVTRLYVQVKALEWKIGVPSARAARLSAYPGISDRARSSASCGVTGNSPPSSSRCYIRLVPQTIGTCHRAKRKTPQVRMMSFAQRSLPCQ